MQYQIGHFRLDVQARTLTSEGKEMPIRPKTLTLLLYLAERKGQVISKQELLNCVWDDVNVDDGVIFQSVSEVRKLFANPQIILNYPRRGYEFTEELVLIEEKAPSPALKLSFNKRYVFAFLAVLVVAVTSFFALREQQAEGYHQTIVVLPIKNKIPYIENNWIYLGGMEQLIAKLDGLPNSIFVHQGTNIPRLMHVAGLERYYQTDAVKKLFSTAAATLIVESEVYGDSYDYKLVYKLHSLESVKEGVILDSSIDGALTQLSHKVALEIDKPLAKSQTAPSKEFNDALFAKAITTYESDWYSSISFFESYLKLDPSSVIARIYLAKLYLWHDRAEDAQVIIDEVDKISVTDHDLVVHVKLIKGLIAEKKGDGPLAMQLLEQAHESIREDTDLIIKIRILEEQGKIYSEYGKYEKALIALNQALTYYKIINSPTGINSTRLELALLHHKQGRKLEAQEKLNLAEQDIEKVKLNFLYDRLKATQKAINQAP